MQRGDAACAQNAERAPSLHADIGDDMRQRCGAADEGPVAFGSATDLLDEGFVRAFGEALLRETARRGKVRGAKFVKLEVDLTNGGGARFYERLGFKKKLEDRLFILEQDGLNYFIAERETP